MNFELYQKIATTNDEIAYTVKSKTSVLNHVFIFVKFQRKIEQLKSLTIFSDYFITQ